MRPVTTILVPTDFSAASRRALEYACEIADRFGATLHLLHVLENPFAGGGYWEMYAPPPEGYLENLDRQARAHLDEQLTPEQKAKYSATFVTRMGAPAHEILAYVKEHGAIDFVVMATTGRGAVSRLMIGSVTDKVVRSAPCPVLTLHAHDRTPATAERAA
jgi:nucleotide-binding universal stress UspA family protein